MDNPLIALESHAELTPTQVAALTGIPRPTYYQYRRTGEMPLHVQRLAEVLMLLPKRTLMTLIDEHVYGNEL